MPNYNVDDLKGRSVIDEGGTTIGEVKDLVFDADHWTVDSIVVDLRKEVADDLHIDKPAFGKAHLKISRERVRTVGDNVMLNVTSDDIAQLLRTGGAAQGAEIHERTD